MKLRLHLTSRIVLIFVLFATVLLATVGLISYQSGRESLKAAAVSELLAVAIEKEAELDTWLDERTGDLEELAHASNLQQEIGTLTGAGSDPSVAETARQRIVAQLQPNVGGKRSGYVELFVIEPGGKIIASTDPAQEGKSKSGHLYFENGKNDSYLQAPYLSPDLKAPAMTAAVPLRTLEGGLVAVLAARLDLVSLNTIVQRRTGLRQTDDSYFVNADRVFVTPPRFITEPVTLRRTIDTEAVRRCVGRNSGVVFAPDHRGISSIVVYRWNAKRKLGLIAKIDEAEAFAPARAFGRSILLISGLALIGAALVASRLARTITRPVRALHASVTNFAAGKTSTPLPGNARDELGLLATEPLISF